MNKSDAIILIVDDDITFSTELAEQISMADNFHVDLAHDVQGALEKTDIQAYDAIVLDVNLPDGNGQELCKKLRDRKIKSPIILLTAQDSDADVIKGLDSGANDYIVKPVRLGVLRARLRAQLRQYEMSDDAIFNIGPYKFKPSAKMLDHGNRKIHLTEKEVSILKFLYRVGDIAVSRDQLLGEVWGYNADVTTHTLETHIYRLRQKIEPVAGKTSLLVTEAGGYRLVRSSAEIGQASAADEVE